jgi:hypothetical protein
MSQVTLQALADAWNRHDADALMSLMTAEPTIARGLSASCGFAIPTDFA